MKYIKAVNDLIFLGLSKNLIADVMFFFSNDEVTAWWTSVNDLPQK